MKELTLIHEYKQEHFLVKYINPEISVIQDLQIHELELPLFLAQSNITFWSLRAVLPHIPVDLHAKLLDAETVVAIAFDQEYKPQNPIEYLMCIEYAALCISTARTFAFYIFGQDPDSMAPETQDALELWKPFIRSVLNGNSVHKL